MTRLDTLNQIIWFIEIGKFHIKKKWTWIKKSGNGVCWGQRQTVGVHSVVLVDLVWEVSPSLKYGGGLASGIYGKASLREEITEEKPQDKSVSAVFEGQQEDLVAKRNGLKPNTMGSGTFDFS